MKKTLMFVLALGIAVPSFAQTVLPVTYRVTRAATGQTTVTHTFQKAAMLCDLAVAVPVAGGLRVTDPELSTRDCEISGAGIAPIFANMVRELEYSYTIAGQNNAIDGYGPESVAVRITLPRIPQIPGAPQSPRIVPPTTPSVAVLGTIIQRGPAFGLDTATATLEGLPGFLLHFGAQTLNTGGAYSGVMVGDEILFQLWRP